MTTTTGTKPGRTTASILLWAGLALALAALLALISTGNIFIGILSSALLVIGATSALLATALFAVLANL